MEILFFVHAKVKFDTTEYGAERERERKNEMRCVARQRNIARQKNYNTFALQLIGSVAGD